jgi:hypothetical protein
MKKKNIYLLPAEDPIPSPGHPDEYTGFLSSTPGFDIQVI